MKGWRGTWSGDRQTLAGAFYIGWGMYIVVDAIEAARTWALRGDAPTGLGTDLASAFAGRAGAVALEILFGLLFCVLGARDVIAARKRSR